MKTPFIYLSLNQKGISSLFSSKVEEEKGFFKLKDKIRIRKRKSYPHTFLFKTKNRITLGYIKPALLKTLKKEVEKERLKQFIIFLKKDLRKEFLIITIKKPEEIRIYRDSLCTIPLFYFKDKKRFALSNEFTALLPFLSRPVSLHFKTLAEYLLALTSSPDRTVLDKIRLVTERSTLIKTKKEMIIKFPEPCLVPKIKYKKEEALSLFEKNLEQAFLNTWAKVKNISGLGFELSGGVDSALPLSYFSKKTKAPLKTFSMILPHQTTQEKKIKDLSQKFNLKTFAEPVKKHHPLKEQKEKLSAFYPLKEIYSEALNALAKKAGDQKIEIVITGMGGDEAFILDPGEEKGYKGLLLKEKREKITVPSYFTPRFKSHLLIKEEAFPAPAVPYSVLGANASRNNIYLRRDIWPLSPLADPYLSSFCRALPKNLRKDKKILRLFLKKKGYPETVYLPEINEDFSFFFKNSVKKVLEPLFLSLFKDSELKRLALINKKELVKRYKSYTKEKEEADPLSFYTLASIEILLKTLKR